MVVFHRYVSLPEGTLNWSMAGTFSTSNYKWFSNMFPKVEIVRCHVNCWRATEFHQQCGCASSVSDPADCLKLDPRYHKIAALWIYWPTSEKTRFWPCLTMFDPPAFFHHVTQKYPSGISPGPCFSHEVNGYFSSPMDGHETDPQTLHWNYTSMQRQKSWDWWIFIMFIPVYPSISALLKLALLQTLEVAVET